MPDLYIQHVIFTRVESEYSLNQNSGYQIVYQSPSIGTEIGQIEKSLQCFPINDQHIDRYQFFWTEKGQAVIAKSVSLFKPNRNVIDRDQRDAFLAHAIIVSREEFVRVKNDPFAVFEAAEHANLFAEDVEKLVLYLRQAPPSEQIHIPIRQKSRRVPVGWSNKELLKLYIYAQQASTTTRQGQSFLMVSTDQDEIVSLLSIVHLLLAPDERSACTFDTCIDTCSPTAGIFWVIGGTKALSNAGYISLLLAEWKIESKSESRKVPDLKATTYSIWLYDTLQNSTAFQEIHNQLYIAHVIFEALTTKRMHPDSSLLNQSTLESFHKVNRHLIDSKVQTALTAWLGKRIAVDIATSIYSYLPSPDLLSIAAQETCDPQTLAPVVYRWILKEQQGFKQWNNILPLAKQTGYAPLLLLVSVKAQSWKPFFQDDTLRTQAIKALLISGTLSQALHDLWQTWLTPAAFVTEESALTIMDYIHPDKLQDDKEFQELLEVLLRSGVGGRLTEAYIQRVATLQNKSAIITLARTVKQTTNVTPGLKQALQLCSESFQSKERRKGRGGSDDV